MTDEEILYTPEILDVSTDSLANGIADSLIGNNVLPDSSRAKTENIIKNLLKSKTNLDDISNMLDIATIASKEKFNDRQRKTEKSPDFLARVYGKEIEEGTIYPGKIKSLDPKLYESLENRIHYHNRTHPESERIDWSEFFTNLEQENYIQDYQETISKAFGGLSIEDVAAFLRGILPGRGAPGKTSFSR